MLDFARARRNMVDNQLRTFDITDRALLAAMAEVPRERFSPVDRGELAYLDQNLPLTTGAAEPRWMLQPMVDARMIQGLDIEAGDKALDVGAGYGYASAIMAALGADVVALESDEGLAGAARERLAGEGRVVEIRSGPLDKGAPDQAPFDVILVNGALECRPDALLAQLKDGGRLACLERDGAAGHAVLYVRAGEGFGNRRLFEASAPILSAFAAPAAFRF